MKRVRKIEMEEFEAIQYTGENAHKVAEFICLEVVENEIDGKKCLNVSDPTGDWVINVEQWVLKTLENEVLGTCEKQTFWDHFTTVDVDVD
jgi:hypothetical protein